MLASNPALPLAVQDRHVTSDKPLRHTGYQLLHLGKEVNTCPSEPNDNNNVSIIWSWT